MGWKGYPFINAYIAVDFFFILSGFVLSYVYKQALSEGKINNTIFSLHRFVRMYPLHLATLIATFFIYYFLYNGFPFDRPLYSGVANLALMHGMGMTSDWSWNDPSWSISVEFWASVLMFKILVQKFSNTALFFFSFVCYTIVFNKHNSLMASFDFSYFYLSSGFLKCIGGMALGILLYNLADNKKTQTQQPKIATSLVDGLIFLIIMIFMCVNISVPRVDILMIVFAALLIYRLHTKNSFLRKIIETKPFNFLGKVSFSLYLIHTPIMLVLGKIPQYANLPLGIRFIVFLSITLSISYVLCILFEVRLYKFLKKSIDKNIKIS